MDDDHNKTHELLTDRELSEISQTFTKTEVEGQKNILKYFDRIHDKLFSFNNILIAGYFALSKIKNSIPAINILIPIANLILLLFIEYRMMEKSRFDADVIKKTFEEVNKQEKTIQNTNLISLLTIGTTSIVTIVFLYYSTK